MSRYCGHPIDALLAAAERWKQRCLLQGTSVFTDASLWRPERFAELVHHFVEKPDESDKKFYQKLQLQLDPASPEAKKLAAELIWVLMLFPHGNPGLDTKRKNIRGTWGLSGDELPPDHELLATEVLGGVGSVGTGFNTHFWRECAYAIGTFKRVLELDQAKRAELLADGWRLAAWLAQQPMEGKRQFRHILLFLLFPDIFERISSGREKRSILEKYGAPLGLTADPEDAIAIDRALAEVRDKLAQKYGTNELDFYRPPIEAPGMEKSEVGGKQVPPKAKEAKEKEAGYEVTRRPLNLILYGPPGTGKTYQTKRIAVEVIDGRAALDRTELLERFEALRLENRVEFVTFHQSFSYEDFIEGLRPVLQDGQGASSGSIQYECRDGLFKKICAFAEEARTERPGAGIEVAERRVFKMSLGDTQDPDQAGVYDECISNNYVLLGWGEDVDFSAASTLDDVTAMLQARYPEVKPSDYAPKAVYYLKEVMKNGDLVVISDGNTRFRAIGMVDGDYRLLKRSDRANYRQSRPVRWLRVFDESQPIDRIFEKRMSQMTLYLMDPKSVKRDALQALLAPATASKYPQNYVLIVDEINRANIAKVFGELITLLEPDKRIDGAEEIRVRLPYSGKEFGVPGNLYVIGTMNTADRSIALLDTALRRRFEFVELRCDPALIEGDGDGEILDDEGKPINLVFLLRVLNERVEFLKGREFQIGHSYLMRVRTFEDLVAAFRNEVIPLLQEYFFEDWSGIGRVLATMSGAARFVEREEVRGDALFGASVDDLPGSLERGTIYRIAERFTGDMFRALYSHRVADFAALDKSE